MTTLFDALFGETFGQVSQRVDPVARRAYAADQPRDYHGRFGEGNDAGRSIVQTVRKTGGITVKPLDGSSPTTGFVVARPDVKGDVVPAESFFGADGPAQIMAFMDAHADDLSDRDAYLGLWHDTAHHEVALDVVEVIADRGRAIAAGAARDEQAIWDVAGNREISTGGTGHRAAATTMGDSYGRPSGTPRQAAEAVARHDGGGEAGVGRVGPRGDGGAGGLSPTAARHVASLTKLRQALGTRLLAAAQLAYETALTQAGRKVIGRARARTSSTRQRQVRAAVASRGPLAPILAAVGLDEAEMLAHVFEPFHDHVIDEITRYRSRQQAIVFKLRERPIAGREDPTPEAIADYLVAGLTAMVRSRLLDGDKAAVTAAAPRMVPRKRALGIPPDGYDLPAGLPDPDELSSAAARLVRNALFAADGRVHVQMPTSPDQLPTVVTTESTMPPTLEEQLALEFNVEPLWEWAHAFYGEPLHPFEAHEQLDGFTTTDRENDPGLINTGSWPDVNVYAPDDHPGCTCEWVPAVG